MSKVLQLYFKTSTGEKVLFTVDEPKESLTAVEVETAMQTIMQSAAFLVNGSPLQAIHSARLVERQTTNIIQE